MYFFSFFARGGEGEEHLAIIILIIIDDIFIDSRREEMYSRRNNSALAIVWISSLSSVKYCVQTVNFWLRDEQRIRIKAHKNGN